VTSTNAAERWSTDLTKGEVVVDPDDGNLFGNRNLFGSTGFQQLESTLIAAHHDSRWFG
jgi:hypothetical protein